MFGIVFHPPSLVSLMIDRERFTTVVVPEGFEQPTQDALEKLFSKKARGGSRKLLLIEGVGTLHRVAALFPEQKVRIVIFDVVDRLEPLTDALIDYTLDGDIKKLRSLKPKALNPALQKLGVTSLEDYRVNYTGDEKIEIANRDGVLVATLSDASEPFQKTAVRYLLGITTFAVLKRSGRQDMARVAKVQQYVEADAGVNLAHAFMDMALYGTESKQAALFSDADLEDLRLIVTLVHPEADTKFTFETPTKLRAARE
jgi:hypothetical protein